MEDGSTLEPSIGWLADTILANLGAGGKLESWIRQAGLGNDVKKLKSEVEAVEMVVSAVQGRAAGNKPLTRSLAHIKELLYDADDVVDELDGHRLRHELEPETLLEMDGHGTQQVERSRENTADVQSSSNGRLRSKEWNHFDITEFEQNGGPTRAKCKYCKTELMCTTKKGTSVLRNHLKSKGCSQKRGASDPSSSTADATTIPTHVAAGNLSSRKRMRTDQESTHINAANPNGWNKDAFSERIQDISSQLQGRREAITGILEILGPDSSVASSNHCQSTMLDPCRITSSLVQGKVYGRAAEKRSIKKSIEEHKSTTGVTVLPIVGIGGVGKTALAQLVYNDPALESQFYHKIWLWVSNNFDEMRLTREMLDYVSHETHDGLCSFPKLQEALKGRIKSKRALLILDDVWDDKDHCRWNQLLAPFKSDNAKGNMIIVTTRKPSVAKSRGTTGPIILGGLGKDHFWQVFKSCTFADEIYEVQANLTDLGQEIAQKLKGNPLAAQTAGVILRQCLTVDHWNNILKTEAWKSLEHTGGIMSSLKLSYDELPYHVQQCFSHCSTFPYNYQFLAEEIVCFWISLGYVKHDYSGKSLQEIGQYYLTDLVNLGLFERTRSSPGSQTWYAMCGLMHEFGRLVSRTECATLDGLLCNEFLPNVRHMSIVTSHVYQRDNQTGNISRSEKFESFLQNIVASVRKLRTLLLIGEYDSFYFKAFQDVFGKAHNLRLLQMSATSTDFDSFMCSLVNPTRLRYIKLQDCHTDQQKILPHVLSKFFHLQVLDVALFLSLHTVCIDNWRERIIFPSLEMLRFLKRLKLSNVQRVREVPLPSLEELILEGMQDLQRCSCTCLGDMKSSLRVLQIQRCPALHVFDLFHKDHNYEPEHKPWLPSLRKLIICDCPHLQVQAPLPPSATFSELLISGVSTIMTMEGSSMGIFKIDGNKLLNEMTSLSDKILAFHNLKHIKYLEISSCISLRSISFIGLSELISLKILKIVECRELFSSDDVTEQTHEDMINGCGVALPSLESLYIKECGITGKWLSLMLRLLPILKELDLIGCPQLKRLNFLPYFMTLSSGYANAMMLIPLNLKKIRIGGCPHLIFDGSREGFAGFTSLEDEVEEDCQENDRCLVPQSLEHLDWFDYPREALRPCIVCNLTCLKKLEVTSKSLEYLQLDSCTALEDLEIRCCERLVALEGMQSLGTLRSLVLYGNSRLESLQLHSCTALQDLEIRDCDQIVTLEGMQLLGTLRSLELSKNSGLESLHLNSCTALVRLEICWCSSLVALEGLRSLVNLKHLEILGPTEGISSHSYELFPALESLMINDLSLLNTLFCKGLTRLYLASSEARIQRLTSEQESTLLLLRSLQELQFEDWWYLVDLPAGLRGLPSLKRLEIIGCKRISGLPKEGLPPSLEELVIDQCSVEFSEGCRSLATSKLEVKIDGDYVD